jgi:hypothetical protein
MTNRRSQQASSTEATTEERSVENAVGTLALRLLGSRPVLGCAVAGAVFVLTGIGWTVGDQKWPFKWPPAVEAAEQSVLPPGRYYLVTVDASEKDPAKQIQRKEIELSAGGRVQSGTYRYIGDPGNGRLSLVKRLGETLAISFWSEQVEGPGVGAVFLRPLDYREASLGRVWTGFEVGHDCECSPGISRPGPFTSVPAILSSIPNPPEELLAIARKQATVDEVHFFPDDFLKKKDAQTTPKTAVVATDASAPARSK